MQPVMLGLDCLKEYCQWKAETNPNVNKDMLVIGMSATASEEEQSFGFDHGMHFYSPKPVDMEILKQTLNHKRKAGTLDQVVELIAHENVYSHKASPRDGKESSRDNKRPANSDETK
jgi:CheY-like chemotaxis protein